MKDIMLAVDPGVMNGIAAWDLTTSPPTLIPELFIQLHHQNINDLFRKITDEKQYRVKYLVVEDFLLFGRKARQQTGSRMEASQVIGACKAFASVWGTKSIFMQQSSLLPTATKHAGITMPSDHKQSHRWCAFVHGHHRMLQLGLIKGELESSIEQGRRKSIVELKRERG